MDNNYISLHNHTHYSLLDGMMMPEHMVAKAVELGQFAIAITDHGVCGGMYQLQSLADAAGIIPILGCEMYIAPTKQRKKHHLLVLAKTNQGVKNLIKLSSKSHREGFYYKPTITWNWLNQYGDGLIVSTACAQGEIPQLMLEGRWDDALALALEYYDRFGNDFYLELMPLVPRDTEQGKAFYREQVRINTGLMQIAQKTGIKAICTSDAHYLNVDDWFAHDVLLCVQTLSTLNNPKLQIDLMQLCVKNREQMMASFKQYYPDIPEAFVNQMLDNTVAIADGIDGRLEIGHNIAPVCKSVPDGVMPLKFLYDLCIGNWAKIRVKETAKHLGLDVHTVRQMYVDRLRYELERIESLDFVNYFLLVWDLYRWTRAQNIFAGPARGSSASSLVCYLLEITQVDPMFHGLDFDRFVAPDRVTSPDIDMDFPDIARDKIQQYFYRTYGEDHVAFIGTYGSMKGRMVLKDIGRALSIPYNETNQVTKLVFQRSSGDARASFTALDTLSEFEKAREYADRYPMIVPLCERLEGLFRHGGIHAAGLVVTPKPVDEYVPLERRKDIFVTGTDWRDNDALGLLKMDILGLITLTQLQLALELIEREKGDKIDLYTIPFDDKEVYKRYDKGDLAGVFQFDSYGMARVCREAPVTEFNDIVNLNALYRPSGMRSGLCARYLRRRKGIEAIGHFHPIYDKITEKTRGIIIFQEQVMALFRELADFPAVQVDTMRRNIAKSKGVESLEESRHRFIEGCLSHNMDVEMADALYTSILHFGSYGFNLSHAVAYSYISYWCMWLRIHYPKEFWAAWLTGEKDMDKTKHYISTMGERDGLQLLPPDINQSTDRFEPVESGIRASLVGIKFCGNSAVKEIMGKRPYESFEDFLAKIERRKCNARVVKSLIMVGAFDAFGRRDELYSKFTKETVEWEDELTKAKIAATVYPLPLREHLITHYDKMCEEFDPKVKFTPIGDIDYFGKSEILMLRGIITEIKYNRVGQFEVGDVTPERRVQVERMMKAPWDSNYVDIDLEDNTGAQRVRILTNLYEANSHIINRGVGTPAVIKVETNPYMKLLWAIDMCGLDELKAKREANESLTEFEQGLYDHPLSQYAEFREALHLQTIPEVLKLKTDYITILGTMEGIRTHMDKNGNEMSFCIIGDEAGSMPFIAWTEGHRKYYINSTVLRIGKNVVLQLVRLNEEDWALDVRQGCKALSLEVLYHKWLEKKNEAE